MDLDKNTEAITGAEVTHAPQPPYTPWKRNLETVVIFLTFIGTGLAAGTLGPTLLHLSFLYETNIQGMSIALMALNIGIMIGSVLCGVLYERINRRLVCVVGNAILGSALAVAPRIPHLYGYHAMICVTGIGHGWLISGSSPYIMELWTGKIQAPLIQGIHACFSIGAFVCPFLTIPFLIDIPPWMFEVAANEEAPKNTDNDKPSIVVVVAESALSTTQISANRSKEIENVMEGLQLVKHAYMFIGCVIIGLACLGFVVYLVVKQNTEENSSSNIEVQQVHTNKGTGCLEPWKIALLIFVFIFGVAYFWYDMVASSLLSSFVLKGLLWDVEKGPLITSVFFGGQAIGKLSGIPISYCLTPNIMLIAASILAFLSYLLLAIAALYNPPLVWLASGMAGFSVATCFPSLIVWTGSHIRMTGALGGLFVVAAASGGLSGSYIGGALFEITYMMVPYLALCATAVNLAILALMNCIVVFNRRGDGQRTAVQMDDVKVPLDGTGEEHVCLNAIENT